MNYATLSKLPMFKGVSEVQIEELFMNLKIKSVDFEKGELLAMQNEPVNRLIILLKGSVKAEMNTPSGKYVKVEDLTAPAPLAILFLFGTESNRFPVQVTALEKVTAAVIPKESVLRMLSMNETVLKNYLDISADFAARLSLKVQFLSLGNIRKKIALYLIRLAKESAGDTVEIKMTKTALAEYFGISRPSLERELSAMQSEGLIFSERRRITLRDKRALAELLE